ncbi:MAG: glutathione S-transferase family protein, partial [Deltaproteobacteria bacterium]
MTVAPRPHGSIPVLFSDRGCPFAHRVLALFEHLGCPVERRESLVGDRPEGLERYSASGRIPLLVHGELVLTESRVILEYLTERYGFADALPRDLGDRALHRHAMVVADEHLVPRLTGKASGDDERRLADALDALEAATATAPPRPSLLALHLGPLWLAFGSWQPYGAVTRAIEARPQLREWLDGAARLE